MDKREKLPELPELPELELLEAETDIWFYVGIFIATLLGNILAHLII